MTHDSHRHRLDGLIPAAGPESPHELLGLKPDEDDPIKIIKAAKRRLALLRESLGSETALKRAVAREILAARAAMLAHALRVHRRHHDPLNVGPLNHRPLNGSVTAIPACVGTQNSGQ